MGAGVYWRFMRPVTGQKLDVRTPSSFREMMERAFRSPPPWVLDQTHLERLQGMAAVFPDGAPNPFKELAEAVAKGTAVEVYLEY